MDEESGKHSSYSVYVLTLVAVLLLYVLSVGPVAKFAVKNGLNRNTIRWIYAPVIWLHDHTFLEKPLEGYLDIWGVK